MTPSSPTTMTGRETDLERTTPRPWIAYFTVHGDPHIVTDAARPFATHVASVSTGADDYGRADALLIAAAVNDYDRLRAIEEAARAYIEAERRWLAAGVPPGLGAEADQAAAKLRAALAVKLREEG